MTEADEFSGEPGLSAPHYETDYAHRKPYCDVLFNGSAHSPGGRPIERITAGIRVGPMTKSFDVVGDRIWERSLLITTPSKPRPFHKMPIAYDRAFGGVDIHEDHPEKVETYLYNPVGIGYYPLTKNKELDGKPFPNTEEIGKPVKNRKGRYRPMSLGPIGRNWQPRVAFAGTYDQDWLDNRAPFWPDDFDYRYFQAAPPDQQIPYPKGGEQVVLKNLCFHGITSFRLPKVTLPILFVPYRGEDLQVDPVIDTVLIEPDHGRFMLTWRASLPLRRNCFEINQLVVGKMVQSRQQQANPCGSC